MYLKSLVAFLALLSLGFASAAEPFRKEIVVAPKERETIVIQTEVPVSFNAELVNPDYFEATNCGNCLHIETIDQGSINQLASTFGVGFIRISPENGIVLVDVFHDYDSARNIEVRAEPYDGN